MPRLNDTPRQSVLLAPLPPVQAQPQKVEHQHAHTHTHKIEITLNINLGTGEVHVSTEQDEQDDHVEPLVPEFETSKIAFGKLS